MKLSFTKSMCLLGTIAMFSCAKPLYRPEVIHDPMITEKGEFSGTGSILVLAPYGAPSYDIGVGYSPVNRFALKAAFRARSNSDRYTSNSNEYRRIRNGNTFEAGLGYYAPIDENKFFTVYANAMFGKNKYHDYNTNGNVTDELLDYNYVSFGIQPAAVFVNRRSKMAIGLRAGVYQYQINEMFNVSGSTTDYKVVEGKMYPVVEPYYNIEVGGKNIRFFGQVGFSIVPAELSTESDIFYPKLSIGINVRFPGTKK